MPPWAWELPSLGRVTLGRSALLQHLTPGPALDFLSMQRELLFACLVAGLLACIGSQETGVPGTGTLPQPTIQARGLAPAVEMVAPQRTNPEAGSTGRRLEAAELPPLQ